MKLVSELISNEKYHYVELNHKEYIQDKLWSIGSDIQEHNLVSIRYASDGCIELCTDTELQEKIREVRMKVEVDSASKDILHIYIPQKYFSKKVINEAGLNIVDLPGDGSRNIKEKSHVDAMINKYMALATVNIIACKANEIQSLETLKLPINVDWKNLPHKYIVVITNSYGLGTISLQIKSQG